MKKGLLITPFRVVACILEIIHLERRFTVFVANIMYRESSVITRVFECEDRRSTI